MPAEFTDPYFSHEKLLAQSRRWSADSEVAVAPDGDASLQVIEKPTGADAADLLSYGSRGLVVESEDEHARMGSRRVTADITETSIERHEKSSVLRGSSEDIGVVAALKAFDACGVDLMAGIAKDLRRGLRQVLVELDSH